MFNGVNEEANTAQQFVVIREIKKKKNTNRSSFSSVHLFSVPRWLNRRVYSNLDLNLTAIEQRSFYMQLSVNLVFQSVHSTVFSNCLLLWETSLTPILLPISQQSSWREFVFVSAGNRWCHTPTTFQNSHENQWVICFLLPSLRTDKNHTLADFMQVKLKDKLANPVFRWCVAQLRERMNNWVAVFMI